ncbi:MAG: response regulator [Burkholderiales bacterium]|nr:response regulator [Burkholderiales bacterium]
MSSEHPAATVLLVDDDEMDRFLVGLAIAAAGYRVLEAPCAATGLDLARRERPDALVVDCVMPVIDGLDACRTARADAALRDVPIVMLTGLEDPHLAERARTAGADRLVLKSTDAAPLLEALSLALRARSLPAALRA